MQPSQSPSFLYPISGIRIGCTAAGIKKENRDDLTLIQLPETAKVAAVFTANHFRAAPVRVCQTHLSQTTKIRALLINTGTANAGTGKSGHKDALSCCQAVADLLQLDPTQVLPFSTGVILEPLPMPRILQALPHCLKNAAPDQWSRAAAAILTTDTRSKAVSRQIQLSTYSRPIHITGITKGSGMIKPNMATMLAFVATDAPLIQADLERLIQDLAQQSFNCISVDGDTSTNDSFTLISAPPTQEEPLLASDSPDYALLYQALKEVCIELAQMIIRDGEGATKMISIQVEEGLSLAECRQVANCIAHSPLVKTAFYAQDPNLGRILASIGNAHIPDFEPDKVRVYLNQTCIIEASSRAKHYTEAQGQAIMQEIDILVRVCLGRGTQKTTLWTCDLSHEYVTINAEYRS